MNENKQAVIREELNHLGYQTRGESLSALVELAPGKWMVRTFTNEGILTDEPAEQWYDEHFGSDDDYGPAGTAETPDHSNSRFDGDRPAIEGEGEVHIPMTVTQAERFALEQIQGCKTAHVRDEDDVSFLLDLVIEDPDGEHKVKAIVYPGVLGSPPDIEVENH